MKQKRPLKSPKKSRISNTPPLSFPHLYILEASAGSGKTRRLAQRYVDFLLYHPERAPVPFDFRNILAITFTNEAADQMRQEILKMLKTRALGKDKSSARAMHIVEEIMQNFSDFAVRTIDSFMHSLLVASSLELKLPPDYEIMPQPRPYLEYVLDNLLEEILYNSEISSLFSRFLNHFLIVEGQRYWNPKKILLDLLDRFYREENSRAKRFLEISGDLDLNQLEEELKERIRQFLSYLIALPSPGCAFSYPNPTMYCKGGRVNQRFIKGLNSALDNSGSHFLKTLNPHINKSPYPGKGIFNKQANQPDAVFIRHWQELQNQYHNFAHTFVWLRYSFYLKVFSQFRQRLEDFKQEKRIVFLDELNRKARQFLTSEGLLSAEIYYKLSSVLYHYLIDEFQDTSILQWENIQPLVEDALSKGGSLFYVGDKKQAIYRFRGGEVELFDLVKARLKGKVAKIYNEALTLNYRSREVIVEFNNSVFSQENLRNFLFNFPQLTREFQEKILAVFKDSKQKQAGANSRGGYVRLQTIEGNNRQQIQESLNPILKETILNISRGFRYRDILILVRDNLEAELIAGFLLGQGIPVCASRTISIRQNYLILQIISLLKFLNSPIDNLCFATFILSDIFSQATGLNTKILRAWFEDLRLSQQDGFLYTRFRSAFPDIWQEFLQYLFNAVGFLPVYDLVQTILLKFNIERNFPHCIGFTRRVLEILNTLQQQGKNSLADFIEWLESAEEEDLFVQLPSGLDAIRILTIHKAKGLSSPVVILPFTALDIKVGDFAKAVQETSDGLYLLYLQKEIYQSHPELTLIYQREYFHSLLDELNCLYVGFTRAASELYIFLPRRINRSNNPLIPLLFKHEQNADIKEFGKRITCRTKLKRSARKLTEEIKPPGILPQQMFQNILRDQLIHPEQIIPLRKRYLINRGEVLHYLLAEIDPITFCAEPSSYTKSIQDACRIFNYPDSVEIMQCLLDFLRDPQMQRFFNPESKAFNEKEIVDQYGNLKRIDRLAFTGDRVLVIDYKTGEEYQQNHQEQIREYVDLVKQIYPDKLPEGWLLYVDIKEAHPVNP